MDDQQVTIEKVIYGGKGLSRDLQKVVFIPFTLPGEKVRIQIGKDHGDYMEADPIDILEPSPDRVEPDCMYFGKCGGCQISHAKYDAQVRLKRSMLEEALRRAKIQFSNIETISGTPFGYRHRAQLKWDAKQKRLGFYEKESNRLVDIKECLCLTPGLNRVLVELRSALLRKPVPGLSEMECYENDHGETAVFFNAPAPAWIRDALSKSTQILDPSSSGEPALMFHFRDFVFPMRPDIFLQINPKMIREMVMELEGHYEKEKDKTAVELYCGSGLFTLPLAKRLQKIIACEENPKAIKFARDHYSDRNIRWVCQKAEYFSIPAEASVAILDPPRSGLQKAVVERLLKASLQKISYISCDASSLARDLALLKGKYSIQKMTLLDLFPQTFHFETIAHLEAIKN
jgi:23S rRNA (uracil1939-C5)-methyltransferase